MRARIFQVETSLLKLLPTLLLLLGLVASLPAAETHPGEIVLGNSAAYRGSSRELGIELYRGSMAYFEMVNAEGGINSRPIRILANDDGYNPLPMRLYR